MAQVSRRQVSKSVRVRAPLAQVLVWNEDGGCSKSEQRTVALAQPQPSKRQSCGSSDHVGKATRVAGPQLLLLLPTSNQLRLPLMWQLIAPEAPICSLTADSAVHSSARLLLDWLASTRLCEAQVLSVSSEHQLTLFFWGTVQLVLTMPRLPCVPFETLKQSGRKCSPCLLWSLDWRARDANLRHCARQ